MCVCGVRQRTAQLSALLFFILGCRFKRFSALETKDFRIEQLRKTSDFETSAPGGVTVAGGYSPFQASSLGWERG